MAYPYDQIPKDGYPKAPPADGSQNNPLNTEVGRNLSNLASAIPGAAGVPGAVAMGTGLAARALGASAPAVGLVGRAVQAAAPYAPVAAGAVALNAATTPSSATTASPTAASTTAPAPLPTTAPAPQAAPVQVGMATTPPLTGGQPSSQTAGAADNMASRGLASAATGAAPGNVATPVVPNSTNDWAARNALRSAQVSASSITANGGRFDQSGRGDSPEVSAYKAAVATDQALQQAQPGLAAAAMRENAGIQREGMQQQGANVRSLGQIAVEQQKVNQAAVTQGIDNQGKTMVQALQSQIATEPDSAKRQGIAQRLREMQGQSTADPYLVVPGGQAVDEMGKPYNMPSTVFNRQTQQFVQQPKQGNQSPYPEGQRLTGKDGKTYVVKNGVPVPA